MIARCKPVAGGKQVVALRLGRKTRCLTRKCMARMSNNLPAIRKRVESMNLRWLKTMVVVISESQWRREGDGDDEVG